MIPSKINSNNPYMQLLSNNASTIPTQISQPPTECNHNQLISEIHDNVIKLLEKKQKKAKNTYFKITKAMFDTEIMPNYPDFPADKINLLFSDGQSYYIEIGHKKYPLNKKYFLKFISYILKL